MKYLLLSFYFGLMATVVVVLNVSNVLALEDQFTVRLNVIGVDIDAPSTPLNVVATGVSTSQIDVTWDDSTDNTAVAGYTISRDGAPLATTTATLYNDIGLSSATTYQYVVRAFDASGNYSSSSATSSGTTLTPAPPTSTSTSSNLSGSRPFFNLFGNNLKLERISIAPVDDQSLRVDFTINQSVIARVFWGTTTDYELGSASHLLLGANHIFIIDELEPEARYFIKIEVMGVLGQQLFLGPYTAQTRLAKPVNPFDLSGLSVSDGIILSWRYPSYVGAYDVRLLRSENTYPHDPFDGTLVYEGRATAVKDTNVLPGRRYYYTLFGVLDGGRYSSGVVTSVTHRQNNEFTSPLLPVEGSLSGGELIIIQNKVIIPTEGVWHVVPRQPLSIRFSPLDKARDALERVVISFSNESEAMHDSYLLYFDSVLGVFTGEIDPGSEGAQSFVVSGYNRQGELILKSSGRLIVESDSMSHFKWAWLPLVMLLLRIIASIIFVSLGWLTFLGALWS